ncbi:MAG: 4'-phosphopantetheinyl transferase superfamily protein [Ruminococcus sp.]|nr:4'-phosphopantetheinyl transferase superfamily protein [Ruminococcus sp.]
MKWDIFNINDLSEKEYIRYYSFMNDEKKNRVDHLSKKSDKIRLVVGDMMARKAVSKWCAVREESIKFEKGPHGKPYAKNLKAEFNISHSHDMVVCAVSDKPVGIDIEKIRPINLSVAKRICTEDELLYLFGFTPENTDFTHCENYEVLERFFRLWTAKEAFVKHSGEGLSIGLKRECECETFIIDSYVVSIKK